MSATANSGQHPRRSPPAPSTRIHSDVMLLIVLEALAALLILLLIVWWTMFSGRRKGELPEDARDDGPDAPR